MIHEVGIAAQSGAYKIPWRWGFPGKPIKPEIQVRWFTAACRVARQHDMDGIYYWNLSFHADPTAREPHLGEPSAFVCRPAEDAIRRCFNQETTRETTP